MCHFRVYSNHKKANKFYLLSVQACNIFWRQIFQIIDEISCDWRVCIFYIIDATRHIGLCKKAGSCYCGVFNVLIILKCVSIEDLSFKMHTGLVTTMSLWVSSALDCNLYRWHLFVCLLYISFNLIGQQDSQIQGATCKDCSVKQK